MRDVCLNIITLFAYKDENEDIIIGKRANKFIIYYNKSIMAFRMRQHSNYIGKNIGKNIIQQEMIVKAVQSRYGYIHLANIISKDISNSSKHETRDTTQDIPSMMLDDIPHLTDMSDFIVGDDTLTYDQTLRVWKVI